MKGDLFPLGKINADNIILMTAGNAEKKKQI